MDFMPDYVEPNILFFRGISPEKYNPDTIFTNRLLELERAADASAYEDDTSTFFWPIDDSDPLDETQIPDPRAENKGLAEAHFSEAESRISNAEARILGMRSLIQENKTDTSLDAPDIGIKFDKIPEYFISPVEWPKSMNIRCWQCHRFFKTTPRTTITHIENAGLEIVRMKTHGVMCSFDHAMQYIDLHFPEKRINWERKKMLSILYTKMTGEPPPTVWPHVEPPFAMIQYGGDMTVAEYVKLIQYI